MQAAGTVPLTAVMLWRWPEGADGLGVCVPSRAAAASRAEGVHQGTVTRSRDRRRPAQPGARAAVRTAAQGLEETREDRMRDRERIRAADAFDDFDRRVEKHWTEKARLGGGAGLHARSRSLGAVRVRVVPDVGLLLDD